MRHQFEWSIEGLDLPGAFALQRALWNGELSDAVARALNVEANQVQHAKLLIEHERERIQFKGVHTFFPWSQEPGFLQNPRGISLFKRQLSYLQRNPGKIREILKLPPALSPNGWQLEHARVLLGFLHEQAFDAPWTVTLRAAPAAMLVKGASEIIGAAETALKGQADRIKVVTAPRIEPDPRAIRVALSRSDMAGAPGLGDAIQAAALVAVLHYRLICHEHALYTIEQPHPGGKDATTLK